MSAVSSHTTRLSAGLDPKHSNRRPKRAGVRNWRVQDGQRHPVVVRYLP